MLAVHPAVCLLLKAAASALCLLISYSKQQSIWTVLLLQCTHTMVHNRASLLLITLQAINLT
jgi:hypothetical protein